MQVALPNTVRHHGLAIPRDMIVRTMRGQYTRLADRDEWIEYVPAPPLPVLFRGRRGVWLHDRFYPST